MTNDKLARWWLILVGVVLVAVGLIGFVSNPLVGEEGIVATDALHNIVHVVTGLLALGIVYAMADRLAMGAMLFGVLYGAVFVLTVVSPTLFGLFTVEVNAVDHAIHIAVAVVSLGLGYMARSASPMATT